MSAYLCSDEHIRQLAAWLCGRDQSTLRHIAYHTNHPCSDYGAHYVSAEEMADHIAGIMLAENYRSLSARYGDEDQPHELAKITLGEIERMRTIPLGKIAKSLDCYEYQACESDDYERTQAAKVCAIMRKELLRRLPGYEDGNWGAPAEFDKPAPEVISLTDMMMRSGH